MNDFFTNNPILQGMDPVKIQFLKNFATKDKPKNPKDAFAFLMANMHLAKKDNIQFTNKETQLLIEILSKDLSKDEQTKLKNIMSLLNR